MVEWVRRVRGGGKAASTKVQGRQTKRGGREGDGRLTIRPVAGAGHAAALLATGWAGGD